MYQQIPTFKIKLAILNLQNSDTTQDSTSTSTGDNTNTSGNTDGNTSGGADSGSTDTGTTSGSTDTGDTSGSTDTGDTSGSTDTGGDDTGDDDDDEETGYVVTIGGVDHELVLNDNPDQSGWDDDTIANFVGEYYVKDVDVTADQSISFSYEGEVIDENIGPDLGNNNVVSGTDGFLIHNDAEGAGIYFKVWNDGYSFWVTGYAEETHVIKVKVGDGELITANVGSDPDDQGQYVFDVAAVKDEVLSIYYDSDTTPSTNFAADSENSNNLTSDMKFKTSGNVSIYVKADGKIWVTCPATQFDITIDEDVIEENNNVFVNSWNGYTNIKSFVEDGKVYLINDCVGFLVAQTTADTVDGIVWGGDNNNVSGQSNDAIFEKDDVGIVYSKYGDDYVAYSGLVEVEFTVDMGETGVSTNGLHIAGNFNGWSTSATELALDSGTKYSATVDLGRGTTVNFKFINGDSWDDVEGISGNRSLDVKEGSAYAGEYGAITEFLVNVYLKGRASNDASAEWKSLSWWNSDDQITYAHAWDGTNDKYFEVEYQHNDWDGSSTVYYTFVADFVPTGVQFLRCNKETVTEVPTAWPGDDNVYNSGQSDNVYASGSNYGVDIIIVC